MSCMLIASPRPLTISPFSVKAVCLLMLLESERPLNLDVRTVCSKDDEMV